ncbi:hypothetical protein, partial [Lacticaseibacillus paracasei]|uniref:hypothetical protein n=1 Tax=Lacticaseibacillus paracasei TaxID=1597 RepID=UPI0021A63024
LDGMLCKHHFSKNGQVFFHIFWVVTLIMQSRKNKLTGLFPFEYKKIFNMAKTYELHSGHYHSERFKDDRGIMWRQLGTAKPNDPYEIKNGFTTGKHLLYAFVYDDTRLRCTYELN